MGNCRGFFVFESFVKFRLNYCIKENVFNFVE